MLRQFHYLLHVVVLCACTSAMAQTSTAPPVKREIIPGSELMTAGEREQYRQRFGAAKTPEAQEKVRTEHRQHIRERARLHGLQLADEPPAAKGAKP